MPPQFPDAKQHEPHRHQQAQPYTPTWRTSDKRSCRQRHECQADADVPPSKQAHRSHHRSSPQRSCLAIFAHHGTGVSYDNSKTYTVKATVTEFRYANPHPQLFFDVKDDKGSVVHWSGEIAPNPAQLVQVGWGGKRSEAALATGTEVTLTIAPSFAGTPVGLVTKIEKQ